MRRKRGGDDAADGSNLAPAIAPMSGSPGTTVAMYAMAGLTVGAGLIGRNFPSVGALDPQQSAARIAGPQSWSPCWQHAMSSADGGLSGRQPANAQEATDRANAHANAARQKRDIILILVPMAGGVKSRSSGLVGSFELGLHNDLTFNRSTCDHGGHRSLLSQ